MIYDSNRRKPELDKELFKNPTAEYRGAPFWAWNCDLEKNELLRQIDIFKEMGLGGFHMHCRDGMSTEYLSEDFMDLVKSCTKHAKENEMLAWLYDEDKCPRDLREATLQRTKNSVRDISHSLVTPITMSVPIQRFSHALT